MVFYVVINDIKAAFQHGSGEEFSHLLITGWLNTCHEASKDRHDDDLHQDGFACALGVGLDDEAGRKCALWYPNWPIKIYCFCDGGTEM